MRLVSMVKPKARLLYNNSLVGYRIEYLGEIFDIDNKHFDWFMYDCHRENELLDGSFPVYELVKQNGLLVVPTDPKEYPELTYNELANITNFFRGKSDYELRALYVKYNNQYFGGKLSRQIKLVWSGQLTNSGGNYTNFPLTAKGGYLDNELYHQIKLSKKYLLDRSGNRNELFKNVLLHEMIHVEHPNESHGDNFMSSVKRFKDEFNIDIPVTLDVNDVPDDSFKQIVECQICGKRYRLHKKLKNLEKSRCGVKTCGGRLKDVTDYYEEGY